MFLSQVASNMATINSLRPSDAYMRQKTNRHSLVQMMACRLDDAKPLSEPILNTINWTPRNTFQWIFFLNSKVFFHENALENVVCEMAAIFVSVLIMSWQRPTLHFHPLLCTSDARFTSMDQL